MNNVIFGGSDAALRMTSQEIADLVEKRHDNVKRTIETLANQGVITFPQIEDIPTAPQIEEVRIQRERREVH